MINILLLLSLEGNLLINIRSINNSNSRALISIGLLILITSSTTRGTILLSTVSSDSNSSSSASITASLLNTNTRDELIWLSDTRNIDGSNILSIIKNS